MQGRSYQRAFARNRAEELGQDVWEHFVVPHFFDRLDLFAATKPHLIVGGRGCGKTMLLRYLSHQTMFSPKRRNIPVTAAAHIGLYWRADTHFLNAMSNRGVPDDVWQSAFMHMAAIVLGMEVISGLRAIAGSACPAVAPEDLFKVQFSGVTAFDPTLRVGFDELYQDLEHRLWALQAWVNNVRKAPEPTFLPGDKFLAALITHIKRTLPQLQETIFFVYIDEYENLNAMQKKIVNTWLKHTQPPLVFNLAMKRNALDVQETTGPEPISHIHDFRVHDLEAEMEGSFPTFAAEILLLQLANYGAETPVDAALLRDTTRIDERRNPAYQARINSIADKLFPGMSQRELAATVFTDRSLSAKLRERIRLALSARQSSISIEKYFRPDLPEASIITPALLRRRNLQPEKIATELDKLEKGEESTFAAPTDWIHNNVIGSLLQLYEPHSRACPFYAGFRSFCHLAHGNIRYLLELCHKSLVQVDAYTPFDPVPVQTQAEAAREASSAFLREIRSFGPKGLQLHTFVMRLGSLLALAHQRPAQSEPEQTHFSVGRGRTDLTRDDQAFLREAVKWSVLYEEEETKQKSPDEPANTEYILAPIYAPYFHISYRKKRRLQLTTDELITLVRGAYEDVRELLRKYRAEWDIDEAELTPTLFAHLEDPEQ